MEKQEVLDAIKQNKTVKTTELIGFGIVLSTSTTRKVHLLDGNGDTHKENWSNHEYKLCN